MVAEQESVYESGLVANEVIAQKVIKTILIRRVGYLDRATSQLRGTG
jgi:hypothetical protein